MSLIKSNQDLASIRIAGKKLAAVLSKAQHHVRAGMSTSELDAFITKEIAEEGATPSFLHYDGFPAASCLSVNDQVVHGIPSSRILKEGDIVGIDVGLWYKSVCVDAAITVAIGKVDPAVTKLLEVTHASLLAGIKAAKPFKRVGQISNTIQAFAQENDYGIVRALTGHGVGHAVHESPDVPNYGSPSDGALLKPGMVLAIEPMFTLGTGEVLTEVDGWTVVTADGSFSAHFEHTVIITNRGAEIVTKPLA